MSIPESEGFVLGPTASAVVRGPGGLELVTLDAGSRPIADSGGAFYLTGSPDGHHFAFWTRACRVLDRNLDEVYSRTYWGDKGAPCGVAFSPTGDGVVVLHEADGMSRIAFFQLRKHYSRELNWYHAFDLGFRRFVGQERMLDGGQDPLGQSWDNSSTTAPVWDRVGDHRGTVPNLFAQTRWDEVTALQPHARGLVTLSGDNMLSWLDPEGAGLGECQIPARDRSGFFRYGRPLSVSRELALVYDRDAGWAVGAHRVAGVVWSAEDLVWATLVEGGFLTTTRHGRTTLINQDGSVDLTVRAPQYALQLTPSFFQGVLHTGYLEPRSRRLVCVNYPRSGRAGL